MLKKLLTGLIVLSFFACNNANHEVDSHVAKPSAADEHAHAAEAKPETGLSLNYGAKWKTDESTRFHASNLVKAIDAFHANDHQEVTEYHLFAAELQRELGGLVKNCKMTGRDHDALHLWLEPVMKDASDLKTVTSIGEGKRLSGNLKTNITKFNQYFYNADQLAN